MTESPLTTDDAKNVFMKDIFQLKPGDNTPISDRHVATRISDIISHGCDVADLCIEACSTVLDRALLAENLDPEIAGRITSVRGLIGADVMRGFLELQDSEKPHSEDAAPESLNHVLEQILAGKVQASDASEFLQLIRDRLPTDIHEARDYKR